MPSSVFARTIYLAGASTLDEHGGDESRWASWGSSLRPFLREGCAIVNYGRSGRSTTSFIREGWWGGTLVVKARAHMGYPPYGSSTPRPGACLAASALDGTSISDASRILVWHLTDLHGEGFAWGGNIVKSSYWPQTGIISWGKGGSLSTRKKLCKSTTRGRR